MTDLDVAERPNVVKGTGVGNTKDVLSADRPSGSGRPAHAGAFPDRPHYSSLKRPPAPMQIWVFRELLRSLVVRDLKVKYQRSVFGFVWTLLNPLLTVVILAAVFSYVIRIPIDHYWAFLLSGYFVWNYIFQVIGSGTHILDAHAGLSRSVAFPKEILVLAAAGSRFIEFLVEMVLVLSVLALLHHGGVPATFALLPFLFLLQILMALGLMMPVVTLAAFYHDVRHVVPIVLMMCFYISPVFYPAEFVPEVIQPYYFLNPFAGLLTLFHDALYHGGMPPAGLVAGVSAASLTIFAIGYAIFRRTERKFAELV